MRTKLNVSGIFCRHLQGADTNISLNYTALKQTMGTGEINHPSLFISATEKECALSFTPTHRPILREQLLR
jgi:hypothetical protein